jgi:hypothetical protein
MTTLYGSLRLRPTRIGFLVSPTNMAALRRVMQVCTCLWGGAYKALDGPPFPLDHLQLGQTQQVAGMVDAFGADRPAAIGYSCPGGNRSSGGQRVRSSE